MAHQTQTYTSGYGGGFPSPRANIAFREVVVLTDGNDIVLDARLMASIRIKAGAGATVSLSYVDSDAATEHSDDTLDDVAADAELILTPTWQYYFVSVAGGSARIGMV